MSKALSVDLRIRVLASVDGGASHREAAERFGVSAAGVSRWRNLQIRQGDVLDRSVATVVPTRLKLMPS
jgi:transposase